MEKLTNRNKNKNPMFTGEISKKNFNVDCSLSCDNSNMFVHVYTNYLDSVYYDLKGKLTDN